jgi:hypothetical protein
MAWKRTAFFASCKCRNQIQVVNAWWASQPQFSNAGKFVKSVEYLEKGGAVSAAASAGS